MSGDDVNAYLKEAAGLEISAKDFRTWHATVMAAVALAVSQYVARSETAKCRAIARAVGEVSGFLGNTPAVCRASYINPRVIELYEEGVTIADALPQLGDGARTASLRLGALPSRRSCACSGTETTPHHPARRAFLDPWQPMRAGDSPSRLLATRES